MKRDTIRLPERTTSVHVFLETDRLILRRFTKDDVDNLVALDGDPEVMRYVTGGPPTSREQIERDHIPAYLAYYERFQGYGFWAAIEKSTGDFLGWFHLRPYKDDAPDEPELGYRLRRAAWGKGYATEGSRALIDKAFAEFGARRVVAFTYGEHLASRRVMEKAGLRLVRTFRLTPEELFEYLGVTDPSLFPGDDVEYAITKAEWEQLAFASDSSNPG
jgi:RimJ/RimL family protein N-acetyltransferase